MRSGSRIRAHIGCQGRQPDVPATDSRSAVIPTGSASVSCIVPLDILRSRGLVERHSNSGHNHRRSSCAPGKPTCNSGTRVKSSEQLTDDLEIFTTHLRIESPIQEDSRNKYQKLHARLSYKSTTAKPAASAHNVDITKE